MPSTAEIQARIETRPDLLGRLKGGDTSALVDLIELGTGARVAQATVRTVRG